MFWLLATIVTVRSQLVLPVSSPTVDSLLAYLQASGRGGSMTSRDDRKLSAGGRGEGVGGPAWWVVGLVLDVSLVRSVTFVVLAASVLLCYLGQWVSVSVQHFSLCNVTLPASFMSFVSSLLSTPILSRVVFCLLRYVCVSLTAARTWLQRQRQGLPSLVSLPRKGERCMYVCVTCVQCRIKVGAIDAADPAGGAYSAPPGPSWI